MSDKFAKFGKFNKPGVTTTEEPAKEEKEDIVEPTKVDETSNTLPPKENKVEEGKEVKTEECSCKDEGCSNNPHWVEASIREEKAYENIERINTFTNENKIGGKEIMEGRKADIIALRVNVRLGDIAAFLKKEITIPFDINLKEFSPEREMQTVDENDRKNMEAIIKKIVAYGDDNSYLATVPVITVDTKYLKAPIDDINLLAIGIKQEKPSLENFNSKYCVPHIVDRAGGQSDVFLDTATVVTLTACELLNNCINKEDVLSKNSQYAIAITFNRRDGYTVEFGNRNYREVR